MPTAASLLQDKTNDHRGGDVATIEPEATVLDAARKMNERRIGSLVVVDSAGKLIGMFTERDVLMRVVADEKPAATTRVGDVMTTPVIACPPTARADEMRGIMREKRIRHLPIVDGKSIVGMISIGDLNLAEAKTLEATVTYLERYMYMP